MFYVIIKITQQVNTGDFQLQATDGQGNVMPQRILLNKPGKNEQLPEGNATMNFVTKDQQQQNDVSQQEKQYQWKEEQYVKPEILIKKPYKEIPVVTSLPKVNQTQEVTESQEKDQKSSQQTKYIPNDDFNPKNYYQLPQGNSKRDFSFIKQDTAKYQNKRKSLQAMYNYNNIVHSNRYSQYQRRSQIPTDYYNVLVPKEGKTPDYVPKETQFMTPEVQTQKHQRSRSPDPWSKQTTWEARKFHTKRIDQTRSSPFDEQQQQFVSSRKPLDEDIKKTLQSHICFENGALSGTEVQKTRRIANKQKDHKSVFMPMDDEYGLVEFKGKSKGLRQPDMDKAGMRPLSQIKDRNQEAAGIKSDQDI